MNENFERRRRLMFADVNHTHFPRIPPATVEARRLHPKTPPPLRSPKRFARPNPSAPRNKRCTLFARATSPLPAHQSRSGHNRAERRRPARAEDILTRPWRFWALPNKSIASRSNREKRITLSDSWDVNRPAALRRCRVDREMESFPANCRAAYRSRSATLAARGNAALAGFAESIHEDDPFRGPGPLFQNSALPKLRIADSIDTML